MASVVSRGILFVISAPSGTGKSTVARQLVSRVDELEFSISYTTRARRDGERDGVEYHFIDRERFDSMIRDGAFLEWAEVFDRRYGTGAAATRAALDEGRNLLLDIDVQGARQVRETGVASVSIMLLPPDYATLESRLKNRRSESPEQLERRLSRARQEVEEYRHFDYVLVNDRMDEAVERLTAIVRAEPSRAGRCAGRVESILETFPAAREGARE